jgi:hypothetical protein
MHTLNRLHFGLQCLLLFLALFMPASNAVRAADTTATVVWFDEQEPGIDPYPVRYIVTPDYMRSDDGLDDGDFLLFDRRQRKIYSVARAARTVLAIDGNGEPPKAPQTLAWHVRERADARAPAIAGIAPLEVALEAGDEVCHTALVAPGFLEPVRAALQEFSQSLAVQQLRTLGNTPPEMQTPCFLSSYLYATDFHVSRGMPLADWNAAGKRREMTDYRMETSVDEALFLVPDDYTLIPAATE